MGPPPPKTATTTTAADEPTTSESPKATVMGPPLPRNPNPSEHELVAESSENNQQELQLNPPHTDTSEISAQVSVSVCNLSNGATSADVEKKHEHRSSNTAVPYTIPPWSGSPGHHFFLEVIKDGAIINRYDVLVVLPFSS